MKTLKYHLNNLLNQILWAFLLLFVFVFSIGGLLILISGAKINFSAIDSSTASFSPFPIWLGLAGLSYFMVLTRSLVRVEIPNQNLEAFTQTFLSFFKLYRVRESKPQQIVLTGKFPAVLAPKITLTQTNNGVEIILPRISAIQLGKKLKTDLNSTPLYIPSFFALSVKFVVVGFLCLTLMTVWLLLSKSNRDAMNRGAIHRIKTDCIAASKQEMSTQGQENAQNLQLAQSYCACYANEVMQRLSLSELFFIRFSSTSKIEEHPKIKAAIDKCIKM